jgi:hypothetical protein
MVLVQVSYAGVMKGWRVMAVVALAAAGSLGLGCVAGEDEEGAVAGGRIRGEVVSPFAPVALRVHPLTHVDPGQAGAAGEAGVALVILHVELLDRFGDTVKAAGPVKVELYRPGAGAMAAMETREAEWWLTEMAEPEVNASRFDRATRTYRLPLRLSGWPAAWAQGGEGPAYVRLVVMAECVGPDGRERSLEGEYVLRRGRE